MTSHKSFCYPQKNITHHSYLSGLSIKQRVYIYIDVLASLHTTLYPSRSNHRKPSRNALTEIDY